MMEKRMGVAALALMAAAALCMPLASAESEVIDFGVEAPLDYTGPNSPPICSVSVIPESGVAPLDVTFSLSASDSDGSISSWELDVDDDGTAEYSGSGGPPATQDHTYSSAGTYTARLTVTDDNATTGEDTATVTVSESTAASETIQFGIAATLDYTPAESPPDYEIISFGVEAPLDYTASDANQPPEIVWNSPANGSSDVNTTVTLNISVSDPDGDTLTVVFQNWTGGVWESINVTTAANGSVTYEWSGLAYNTTYRVRASVNDSLHLVNSDSIEFTTIVEGEMPNEPPTADFSWTADGLTVSFADDSTDIDGNITGWSWEFGDGSGSSLQNPTHTYSSDGTYQVNLTVIDDDGATDTASASLVVSSGSGDTTWGSYDTTLIYIAIGAVVLVAIVALFLNGRRR